MVRSDRVCVAGTTGCEQGDVKYGQTCLTPYNCNQEDMYVDMSKTMCVACAERSETPNAATGMCDCAEKYKFNADKLVCKKTGLSAGAIVGVVIGCIVMAAGIAVILYFAVFRKRSGTAVGNPMGDTVTGNNDTTFLPAK